MKQVFGGAIVALVLFAHPAAAQEKPEIPKLRLVVEIGNEVWKQ